MTTISVTKGNISGQAPPFRTILIVTMIVIVLFASHAFARHGLHAVAVRVCMHSDGPIETWQHPDGRQADVCRIWTGNFGIQITRAGDEITAMVKEKMRTLEQVQNYLKNAGYLPK